LGEHPFMKKVPGNRFAAPPSLPELPLMFSIVADKPRP
jgi:hypothetical protein